MMMVLATICGLLGWIFANAAGRAGQDNNKSAEVLGDVIALLFIFLAAYFARAA